MQARCAATFRRRMKTKPAVSRPALSVLRSALTVGSAATFAATAPPGARPSMSTPRTSSATAEIAPIPTRTTRSPTRPASPGTAREYIEECPGPRGVTSVRGMGDRVGAPHVVSSGSASSRSAHLRLHLLGEILELVVAETLSQLEHLVLFL